MTRYPSLRFVPPLTVVVVTLGFLVLTYRLPEDTRAAPLLVGWGTLLLALVDLATRLRGPVGPLLMRLLNPAGLSADDEGPGAEDMLKSIKAMGMIVLLVVALLLVGVVPASLLFIAGAYLAGGSRRWLAVAVAAGFTLFLWLTFALMLRLPLYPGLLFDGAF